MTPSYGGHRSLEAACLHTDGSGSRGKPGSPTGCKPQGQGPHKPFFQAWKEQALVYNLLLQKTHRGPGGRREEGVLLAPLAWPQPVTCSRFVTARFLHSCRVLRSHPLQRPLHKKLLAGGYMRKGTGWRRGSQDLEAGSRGSLHPPHTTASHGHGLCCLEVFPLSRLPPESGTRHNFSPLLEEGMAGKGSTHAQEPFPLQEE